MHRTRISAPDLVKNWNWRRFDEKTPPDGDQGAGQFRSRRFRIAPWAKGYHRIRTKEYRNPARVFPKLNVVTVNHSLGAFLRSFAANRRAPRSYVAMEAGSGRM
jgi:hypothetical protein